MAVLSRREAANIIRSTLASVQNKIDVPKTFINYAGAAGVAVTTTFPVADPITKMNTPAASAAAMVDAIKSMTTVSAKTLRLRFIRQGDNLTNYYYGYVPGSAPVQSQLNPSPAYSIFASNQMASRSAFMALCNNLNTKIRAHADNNMITVYYCHSSCHSSCHTSRGRR